MALKNRRAFELRLGKLGLVLFIIGMSLLLFSGFLMGVVVGKQMEAYPERYASGIMELIRDSLLAASPKAAHKDARDAGEEKFNLTFYETLGGKKGGTAPDNRNGDAKSKAPEIPTGQVAQPVNPPRTEVPVVSPEESVSHVTPLTPVEEGGQNKQTRLSEGPTGTTGAQKPSASEVTAAQQVKMLPPVGNGRFEVQAAAYREKQKAERLVKKCKALGFSPHITMKDLPDKGRWFRVIVDGFESREKAQEAADRMVAKIRGIKCVIRASGSNGN